MKFEQILYEVDDQIALITLNRPDKLNAWTVQMKDELIEAFDMADKDDRYDLTNRFSSPVIIQVPYSSAKTISPCSISSISS